MRIKTNRNEALGRIKPGTVVMDVERVPMFYIVTDMKTADGRIWIVELSDGHACQANGAATNFIPLDNAVMRLDGNSSANEADSPEKKPFDADKPTERERNDDNARYAAS